MAEERRRGTGWIEVAKDPRQFLALGLCSDAWLSAALPCLLTAQRAANAAGGELVHGDVCCDNLCVSPDRLVPTDWNHPGGGNRALELAFEAPSIRLEGGPLPETLIGDQPSMAALVSGFWACRAGLPPIADAPRVRHLQLRQLRIALPWAIRALGLPELDRQWARDRFAVLAIAHERGEIDDASWHDQVEEIVADSYLASDDPRRQSGKTGDEDEWRWSRELVLDALPNGGTLLDVGCANGYFMESAERWGERARHRRHGVRRRNLAATCSARP